MELKSRFKLSKKCLDLGIAVAALAAIIPSCTYKESLNSMDPSTICGGIEANDVGIQLTSLEFRNATLKSDGVYFDLYAAVKNCTGKDMPDYTMSVDSIAGLSAVSTSPITLKALGRDASSTSKSFGNYFYDTTSPAPAVFRLKIETPDDIQHIEEEMEISSLIPSFSVTPSYLTIIDGSNPSNGDYLIDPGERITFNIKAKNLSATRVQGLSAKIESNSSYFTISSGSNANMGEIAPYLELIAGSTTTINISPDAPHGTSGTLTVTLTDQYNRSWIKSIELTVR